jgi:hypothetical protein
VGGRYEVRGLARFVSVGVHADVCTPAPGVSLLRHHSEQNPFSDSTPRELKKVLARVVRGGV